MKTALLTAGLLISSGSAVYFYSTSGAGDRDFLKGENDRLTAQVTKLEKDNQELNSELRKSNIEIDNLNKEVSSLESLLKKAKEVHEDEKEALQKKSSVASLEDSDPEPEMSEMEKKQREQLRGFLSKEIDKNYAALFAEMGLSEEMVKNIKEKLLNRDTEIVAAFFKSFAQTLPKEEGQTMEQALAKSILDSIEKTNAELSLDMGDSFNEFREMEQRGFTLRELSKFEDLLPENSLGDEQRVGLNDLMFEHHNSVLQEVASGETTFKEADEELVNKSSQFLNASQQKTLSNYLKMKRGGN